MVELGFITVGFLLVVTTRALADVIKGLEARGRLGKSSTFSACDGLAGSLEGLVFFLTKLSADVGRLAVMTADIPGRVGNSSSLDLTGGPAGGFSCLALTLPPPGVSDTAGAPGRLGNSSSLLAPAPDLLDQD